MAKQKYWNGTTWEVVGTDAAKVAIADSANHFTATDVEGALAELFQNVSDGKISVRDAITGKGSTVADTDGDGVPTFAELVTGVNAIGTGKKWASGSFNSGSNGSTTTIRGLAFVPSFFIISGAGTRYFMERHFQTNATYNANIAAMNTNPQAYLYQNYLTWYSDGVAFPNSGGMLWVSNYNFDWIAFE